MSAEKLLDKITKNPSLPTLPAVAFRVVEKVNHPDCSVRDLAQIITHDPTLAAKILKVVNSALYGLSSSVTSIGHALQLLGLKRVRALVLGLSLPALKSKKVGQARMQGYWKSSVVGAIAALNLAKTAGDPDPDNAMVAALLRDMGMIILEDLYPKEYPELLSECEDDLIYRQCQLETEKFEVNHAEISAHLLQHWHLPDDISQAVRYHHDPEAGELPPAVHKRAQLLQFASYVAKIDSAEVSPELLAELFRLCRENFAMDESQLEQFLDPLHQQIADLASVLELDIGGCQNYSALLASATEQLTELTLEAQMDNMRLHEEKSMVEKERAEVQDALEKTEEQLRHAQKMEALGRLTGGIAHDFNNLLTIINGYSELVLNQLPEEETFRSFVSEIHKAGQRASTLTRQLLAFSRKQVLTPKVLNLNGAITETEKMLRRLIGEDIELVTTLDSALLQVHVDPAQVDQVVMNLVINARDAMPNGGKLNLTTANVELPGQDMQAYPALRPGTYVMLSIEDTGCGMDDDTKTRMFEPFFTTKEQGKGTGLGMATVHGIVKQNKGHVTVESEPGQGTLIRVYFPPAEEAVATAPTAVTSPNAIHGTETILVVEDEESVRNMVCNVLQMNGYHVLAAKDGVDAIALTDKCSEPIHLLLTDTVMPQIGGRELADTLSGQRREMKVLFMSGYTDEAIFNHGLLDPEMNFLQKPFSPTSLTAKVRQMLEKGANVADGSQDNNLPSLMVSSASSE